MRLPLLFLLPFLFIVVCNANAQTGESWVEPVTKMKFIRIHAGAFVMGTPEGEPERQSDEIRHSVRITRDFYMSETEVTQAQWLRVMGKNPSHFQNCGDCPVETVNYYDIRSFIDRLSDGGSTFRLPTEGEWEYACRAGTQTPFATGENLTTHQANYDGRFPYDHFPRGLFRGKTSMVRAFPANPWGLYDMEGNVWEWCEDWYAPYPRNEVVDPSGATAGQRKVIRGGSWYFAADSARCGLRYTHRPQDSGFSLGFRLIAELP